MDAVVAKRLTEKLVGTSFGGWILEEFIDNGKSAVVFKARKEGQVAAVKVFDPEIVLRFGKDAQLERIAREVSTAGHVHPHLVQIYGGGEEHGFLYVVMEYFAGKNLAAVLQDIPRENIRGIISDVASAAKHLEQLSFAHRDIKPENIGIAPDLRTIKLLDLGVIRPLDLSNVTDEGEQKYFVGTLQYSSPELLFREEMPTIDSWRAVTFYQLGGVLHDLLTGRPLFAEFLNPYPRLVLAVKGSIPVIDNGDLPPELRLLAQNCLHKSASYRLSTVTWEDFDRPEVTDPLDKARLAIRQRTAASSLQLEVPDPEEMAKSQLYPIRASMLNSAIGTCSRERLPRYTLRKADLKHGFMLSILFEPDPRLGISNWLSVFVRGAVIDPVAKISEIRFWANVSASRTLAPGEPADTAPSSNLKGVLIEKDISDHIERGIVLTFASPKLSVDCAGSEWIQPEGMK